MMDRVGKIIGPLILFLFSADAGVFPSKVESECSATWQGVGKSKFVVATVSVVIDLKNSEGNLEERAYIYLNCKGRSEFSGRQKVPEIVGTTCSGVRFAGLDREVLKSDWIFPIHSDALKIISSPNNSNIVIEWDYGGSTFEIKPAMSFSWTMKSALTQRTHRGTVICH